MMRRFLKTREKYEKFRKIVIEHIHEQARQLR